MICSKCNKEILDSSKFCPNCGNKVIDDIEQNKSEKINTTFISSHENNTNKKTYNKKLLIISSSIIIILLIGIISGYQYYENLSKQKSKTAKSISANTQESSSQLDEDEKKAMESLIPVYINIVQGGGNKFFGKFTIINHKLDKDGKSYYVFKDEISQYKYYVDIKTREIFIESSNEFLSYLEFNKKHNEKKEEPKTLTQQEALSILKNKIDSKGNFKFHHLITLDNRQLYTFEYICESEPDYTYAVDIKTGEIFKHTLNNTLESINETKPINKNKPYSGHWVSDNYYNEIYVNINGKNGKTQIAQKPYEVYFIDNENTVIFKQGENIKTLHYNEQKLDTGYLLRVTNDICFAFDNNRNLVETIYKLNTDNETDEWVIQFKYVDDNQMP